MIGGVRLRRATSGLRALLLAPVLIFVFSWPALAPTDPDYWWHERTGQLIADARRVPLTDDFSHTHAGQQLIAHEWLTELVFYGVQHSVGYVGNVVLIGLLGSAAALMMYVTCRRLGVGDLTAVVLVLWAYGMSLGSYGVRPQTITRLLLVVCVFVLFNYRRTGDWRPLLLLPPLFGLWVNLHGGFAVGLGLLGPVLLGDTPDAIRKSCFENVRPLALICVCCALATLLNPTGIAGVLYPLAFLPQTTGANS